MTRLIPLVSVVIPTYNPGSLIDLALTSVLQQRTAASLDVIVVDDGSQDGTANRLRREYPTIRVLDQANSGTAAARNTGVDAAQGEFIAFLDQDDTWDVDKLAHQLPLFDNPDVGLVHSGARFVNPQGEITSLEPGVENLDAHVLLTWCVLLQSTAVVRTDLLRHVGGFDVSLSAADDWDLWIRLALETQLAVVVEPCVSVLVHSGNQSNDPERMYRSAAAVLSKHSSMHVDCSLCTDAVRGADLKNRREYYRRVRNMAKQARRDGHHLAAVALTGRALTRHPRAIAETARHYLS